MAYALRVLTDMEVDYAQIGRSCRRLSSCVKSLMGTFMVVMLFVCRQLTSPSISAKNFNCTAPTSLQRMLLRLQKYNLDVTYLKAEKMLVEDTLSLAYLPEVNCCMFV